MFFGGNIDNPFYVEHIRKMIDTVAYDYVTLIKTDPKMIHDSQIAFVYCSGYIKAFERCGHISGITCNELTEEAKKKLLRLDS